VGPVQAWLGAAGLQMTEVKAPRAETLQRQYALASLVLVALVLGIIFLFGHLISGALSRRYLEDALISGREEAESIAQEMAAVGGEELFYALEKRREVLIHRGTQLAKRQVFVELVVTDCEGNLVLEQQISSSEPLPAEVSSSLTVEGPLPDEVYESERTFEVRAPVGDLGEVVLLISKGRLAERIGRLRRELLVQTTAVAGLTLVALLVAFLLIWHLIQRTRRLERQRHEAQEMASLGALAANLAHEIRNPLNSINLNLELLEEDMGRAAEETQSSLLSTRKEVGRLARLVSDFLTYARPTPPSQVRVRVGELLDEVAEFLRAEVRSLGVHLKVVGDCGDLELAGDISQLRQVLLNLVLNAAQAVAELPPARRVVELHGEGDDGSVALVVRDRGDGIPETEMGKVRDAFYTRRRGGSGLGLAIADRIARAHGGRLVLGNLEPVGFEARLVLPATGGDGNIGGSDAVGQTRGRRRNS